MHYVAMMLLSILCFIPFFLSNIIVILLLLRYIILFASPLAAVKNVIATTSADSIPLPFTIASTINCRKVRVSIVLPYE